MGAVKRIQTAIGDYAVRSANQARRPPRFKFVRLVVMLIAAAYMFYYVRASRGGAFADMASLILLLVPMMEIFADFTRYLYLRGRRGAKSIDGDIFQ